jgi:hypothetical protein
VSNNFQNLWYTISDPFWSLHRIALNCLLCIVMWNLNGQYFCLLAGSGIILTNTYLTVDSCRNDRYQPRKLWSNEHNKCVYKKSLCSEEGQLIYSNGTSIVDRSCHCDYTKGYVFVKRPLRHCYCVPSREECGCLLKQCPNASYVLSPGNSSFLS